MSKGLVDGILGGRALGIVCGVLSAGAFTSATASTQVVVPLRLSGHFPIVVARIGTMDVPLVFDLGDASTVVLQQSVLDRIETTPVGRSMIVHDAKGNMLVSPTFRVPHFQLGDAMFTDVVGRLDVHDPSYPGPHVGQMGFLGSGLLKAYQVVVDYPHLTITLIARGENEVPSENCQGTVVPFLSEKVEPITQAVTDFGRLTLWWDTGSPVSLISRRVTREAQVPQSKVVVTTRLSLGNADFGPWRFRISQFSLAPSFDGFIGYDFFARHIVCIDYPGRRVAIQP